MGQNGSSTVDSVVASTTPPAGRRSAQILAFPAVEKAGTRAEYIASAAVIPATKPTKIPGVPDTYAYRNADGSVKVRTRIRTRDHSHPTSSRIVRHNIDLILGQWASEMVIAAKVHELREMVRRGWNPRGAKMTVREFFYTVVMPRVAQQSRSPKTILSRFKSLIEPYVGDKKIGELTAADIRRWRDELLSDGGR